MRVTVINCIRELCSQKNTNHKVFIGEYKLHLYSTTQWRI